ncbi:MAG: hypothetical protein ABSG67_22225 [Thermoguttaceae bacterium]
MAHAGYVGVTVNKSLSGCVWRFAKQTGQQYVERMNQLYERGADAT